MNENSDGDLYLLADLEAGLLKPDSTQAKLWNELLAVGQLPIFGLDLQLFVCHKNIF